ncbi:MAG: rane protein required for colicin V production [Magnetococcales bacterium]|nr:rane protein required for colicin V production [Magnetococcales bacterium]
MALSALWALFRGFVREMVALVGWVTAVYLAAEFSGRLESLMGSWDFLPFPPEYVASPIIFVVVLLVFFLIGRLTKGWVASKGFSLGDRVAGLVFGVARGGLILMLAIAVHIAVGAPASRWTGDSLLYAYGKKGIVAAADRFSDSALGTKMRQVGLKNSE